MGLNTLTDRADGETILDTFFNDIHDAMNGSFVGRNSSGVATSAQDLGTTAIPWGVIRGASLVLGGAAVDTSQITSPQNRLVSGKVRTTSNQPAFITPNGAAASLIVAGATTNLVYDVNGTEVTISTDITKSSLTTAPAANNTCLVNDTAAADQEDTKTWGEIDHPQQKKITIDTVGSEISALVGKWAAFSIAGVATEYFLAFVESATSLSNVKRGFFYDSTLNPVNRTGFSNNDTITLLSLGWLFAEDNGTTVDISYNNPVWSFTSPSSPATGNYWYDLANSTWYRYDGASFQIIDRSLIGMAIINTTNCIGARCIDFYANHTDELDMMIAVSTNTVVRSIGTEKSVTVMGNRLLFPNSQLSWDIAADLATSVDMYNATEQVSTIYYLYIKDTGDTVISDISPYDRADLKGKYHPHNPWRCVGEAKNDSSSNFVIAGSWKKRDITVRYTTIAGQSITDNTTTIVDYGTSSIDSESLVTTGASWKCYAPITEKFKVDVRMMFGFEAYVPGDSFELDVHKNGSFFCNLEYKLASATMSDYPTFNGTDLIDCACGDYLDIRITQNNAANAAKSLYTAAGYNRIVITGKKR